MSDDNKPDLGYIALLRALIARLLIDSKRAGEACGEQYSRAKQSRLRRRFSEAYKAWTDTKEDDTRVIEITARPHTPDKDN